MLRMKLYDIYLYLLFVQRRFVVKRKKLVRRIRAAMLSCRLYYLRRLAVRSEPLVRYRSEIYEQWRCPAAFKSTNVKDKTTMPIYTKDPTYQIPAPIEGQKPTDVEVLLQLEGLVSAAAKTMVIDLGSVDMSAMDEPPDLSIMAKTKTATGTSQSTTDTLYFTIDEAGEVTFSGALDDVTVTAAKLILHVDGLESLKTVVAAIPTIPGYVDVDNALKPIVTLSVYDGSSWDDIFSVPVSGAAPGLAIDRKWFANMDEIKVTINFGSFYTSSNKFHMPFAFHQVHFFCDFFNSAETIGKWAMLGAGAAVGGATSIGMDALSRELTSSPVMMSAARIVGTTALNLVGSILSALAYAISKNWASWSDLTAENIIAGAKQASTLIGMGINLGSQALAASLGTSMASTITRAIGSGAQGAAGAVAYLTVFSTSKQYAYC